MKRDIYEIKKDQQMATFYDDVLYDEHIWQSYHSYTVNVCILLTIIDTWRYAGLVI